MRRVYQDDERAREFACGVLGYDFAQPYMGLIVEKDGMAVGAIILNGFIRGRNIDLTAAGKGAWSLGVAREIARYCFARAVRITARTSVNNRTAINALKAIGFKTEGVMRDYFPDGDALVLGLLKSEQKLIKVE